MKNVIWIAAVMMVLVAHATAQVARPAGAVTRVYDIRDLIMDIRDFPFDGIIGMPRDESATSGGGGGGQSLFGGGQVEQKERKEQTLEERTDDLKRLITETVEPGSWRDAGGAIGSIRELSGMLIVTQTSEAQQEIGKLLEQLRESHGAVRVQADWVLLEPENVAAMIIGDERGVAPREIDPKALAGLPEDAVHYRAELSCFSGQTVSVVSGRGRTVVYDQEPVVAQSAVAAAPNIRQVQAGLALEVTPLVIAETGSAVLEVGTKVVQWDDPTPATQPVVFGGSDATASVQAGSIDRLNLISQELRTTIRLPLNRPVLVGGMTMEPTTATARGRQLYLIVRVMAGGSQP